MIDGTYKLMVDVPLGPKEGRVVLRTEGDTMFADIDAPVVGKQHLKGTVDGDAFTAKGSGWVLLMGKIEFDMRGAVSGDNLHVDIKTNKGEISLDGVRV